MRMKVHGHELEDALVLLDASPEIRTALVGSECDRRDWAARIVNWHSEATADAELCRLIKQCLLWLR